MACGQRAQPGLPAKPCWTAAEIVRYSDYTDIQGGNAMLFSSSRRVLAFVKRSVYRGHYRRTIVPKERFLMTSDGSVNKSDLVSRFSPLLDVTGSLKRSNQINNGTKRRQFAAFLLQFAAFSIFLSHVQARPVHRLFLIVLRHSVLLHTLAQSEPLFFLRGRTKVILNGHISVSHCFADLC